MKKFRAIYKDTFCLLPPAAKVTLRESLWWIQKNTNSKTSTWQKTVSVGWSNR
jgi:hypothetical protein